MEQKKILCSNENKNITKHISVAAKYNITLNFSILVISCCMHGQKDRNFQKKILFHTLSHITLVVYYIKKIEFRNVLL